VTIDAMVCQKAIARQIIEQQGDYVLALKENHPHLYEDVDSLFHWADNLAFEGLVHDMSQGKQGPRTAGSARVLDDLRPPNVSPC
jgi:predicted transposase YbfD/YdcC